MPLIEFAPGQVWLQEYPIHFACCDFDARMAVIRVSETELMLSIALTYSIDLLALCYCAPIVCWSVFSVLSCSNLRANQSENLSALAPPETSSCASIGRA